MRIVLVLIVTLGAVLNKSAHAQNTIPLNSAEEHVLILTNGTNLRVHMKCPKDQKFLKPWPTVLLFGGFETGAKSIELFNFTAPACLVTFQYPLSIKKKLTLPEFFSHLRNGKTAIHETLEGVNQLVAWIAAQPRFDRNRITLVGASLGAPFTAVVAGQRTDVAALILIHGFGDVPSVISHLLARKWQGPLGAAGTWLAGVTAQLLWWYIDFPSPKEKLALLRTHQRALMLTANEDDLIPAASVAAARAALEVSDAKWNEVRIPGAHVRASEAALIDKLLAESIKWMTAEGLL